MSEKDPDDNAPADPLVRELLNAMGRGFSRHHWVPAPPDSRCPRCGGELERGAPRLGMHWSSGAVRCTACHYRDSVMGYLGRSIIRVEPLPSGAVPIYDRDPDVASCSGSDSEKPKEVLP